MKKISCILFALVLTLTTLTACNKGNAPTVTTTVTDTTAEPETSTGPTTEEPTESPVKDRSEPEEGDSDVSDCPIHCSQFHTVVDLFTGSLDDTLVSPEKTNVWIGSLSDIQTDECLMNLSTFIKHFNISRQSLQKFINDHYESFLKYEINLDVLYSGDKALIDKYYSIKNESLYYNIGLERVNEYYGEKIRALQNIVNEKAEMSSSYNDIWTFESFLYPGGYDDVYYWMKGFVDAGQYDKVNILEYTKRFIITKEDLEKFVKENNLDIYADYNTDIIFSGDQKSIEEYYSVKNETAQKAKIKANYDQYVKQHGTPSADRIAKWKK